MLGSRQLGSRVSELVEQRRPFVLATVVRAQCPTSTRPGDAAVVLPDGAIEGFVGGQCAEESVRTAAIESLTSREELLLRILPDGAEPFPETPGARTVVNPCLSGGAIEVFLEPKLPSPGLVVVGTTPIAIALSEIGRLLGYSVQVATGGADDTSGALAVIVASHGRDEPEAIRSALDAGVGYIGLVASRARGQAVLEAMALTADEQRRVHSPVGIGIGAKTAEEIALSIVADVVRAVRLDGLEAPPGPPEPGAVTAVDPVCGMTVTVLADTPHLQHHGENHWFCNPGCRTRFAGELGGG